MCLQAKATVDLGTQIETGCKKVKNITSLVMPPDKLKLSKSLKSGDLLEITRFETCWKCYSFVFYNYICTGNINMTNSQFSQEPCITKPGFHQDKLLLLGKQYNNCFIFDVCQPNWAPQNMAAWLLLNIIPPDSSNWTKHKAISLFVLNIWKRLIMGQHFKMNCDSYFVCHVIIHIAFIPLTAAGHRTMQLYSTVDASQY